MPITVEWRASVALIRWDDGENRLSLATLEDLNGVLDELDAVPEPIAIVVTGHGRFFCNGIDLRVDPAEPDVIGHTVAELRHTLRRLLLFHAYCVAAINGHAFGAGAILTCAFDSRVMREDRGYWCVNEKQVGIELDPGLMATLMHRVPSTEISRVVDESHRYGGHEAKSVGLVDDACSPSNLVGRAIEMAMSHASLGHAAMARRKHIANGALAAMLT